MKEAWEATWLGERVYLEVTPASFAEGWGKGAFFGLLGRPKARSILLYGNQVVDRREIDQPLLGIKFEFGLMGKAKQPDGQEAQFYVRYTCKIYSECELQINGTPVPVKRVS